MSDLPFITAMANAFTSWSGPRSFDAMVEAPTSSSLVISSNEPPFLIARSKTDNKDWFSKNSLYQRSDSVNPNIYYEFLLTRLHF